MISIRTGDKTFLKLFLYRSWVGINIPVDFGGAAMVNVYAYLDQVISPANAQLLLSSFGGALLPNEVDFQALLAVGGLSLPPGRYGIVVKAGNTGIQFNVVTTWPATGSELMIVGEAA